MSTAPAPVNEHPLARIRLLGMYVEDFERSVGDRALQVLVELGADAARLRLRQGHVR